MIQSFLAIFVGVIVSIIFLEYKKWKIEKLLSGFEKLKHIPILGVAHRFIGVSNDDLPNVYNGLFTESKKSFYCWFGPFLTFGISEPNTIRIVMTSDDCLNKPYIYNMMMCPLSIIATDKEIWRPHRRQLNTTFSSKLLLTYLPKVNEKAKILVDNISEIIDKKPDVYKLIFKCMLDTIAYTTMGTDVTSQTIQGDMVYNVVKNVMHNIQARAVRVWLISDFVYKLTKLSVADQFFRQIGYDIFDEIRFRKVKEIENIEKYEDEDYLERGRQKNKLNLMEKLIWLNRIGFFNENQLLDQMCVIYVAGTDTSSIAIFMTLLMLAIHPECQKKIYDEICQVIDDPNCDITYQHLIQLKQLDYAFKETLRLYPPAPIIVRKTSANVEVPQGTIPKGSFIIFNIRHLHQDQTIWGKNADAFDPTRFYPEYSKDRPAFSYIPFSAGPRNCIGMKHAQMSAKIILTHLIRNFEFSSSLRFEEIQVKYHLVMEISNKDPLQVKKRN